MINFYYIINCCQSRSYHIGFAVNSKMMFIGVLLVQRLGHRTFDKAIVGSISDRGVVKAPTG